ncbi:hypothetical protein BJ508DRAFT_122022 [Ascobolus immersus RN42]|uniref:Uncharacterized protein n=1 Tax=Ascobolus immersus RN42 TaxID=1160509 RepID=A0A3N4IM14_ASCIM|nr:hypothetical protein BJ508DRAFT_122022 [Ascobolus immersus RN42]
MPIRTKSILRNERSRIENRVPNLTDLPSLHNRSRRFLCCPPIHGLGIVTWPETEGISSACRKGINHRCGKYRIGRQGLREICCCAALAMRCWFILREGVRNFLQLFRPAGLFQAQQTHTLLCSQLQLGSVRHTEQKRLKEANSLLDPSVGVCICLSVRGGQLEAAFSIHGMAERSMETRPNITKIGLEGSRRAVEAGREARSSFTEGDGLGVGISEA